ncbi:MAG: DUF4198 domain-containing protein [Thermodesulfobacteriota bacterium]
MRFRHNTLLRSLAAAGLGVALLCPLTAQAHSSWIEVEQPPPAAKTAPAIRLGWGHTLPAEEFLKKEDVEELFILSASGEKIPLIPKSATEFAVRGELATGSHLVAGQRKPGFYTKTTEGGRRQSKKGLANAVRCSWSTMSMKSVVNVGAGNGAVERVVGQPLEIVPLADPAALKAGDTLPVRVLFRGKPLRGEIEAVSVGLADTKESEAGRLTTDQAGIGRLRLAAPGVWLLKVRHELPFPRPDECDVESYVATLTFQVR